MNKFKPTQTPRLEDAEKAQRLVDSKKAVQASQEAISRARRLIHQSKQIMAEIYHRRTGT